MNYCSANFDFHLKIFGKKEFFYFVCTIVFSIEKDVQWRTNTLQIAFATVLEPVFTLQIAFSLVHSKQLIFGLKTTEKLVKKSVALEIWTGCMFFNVTSNAHQKRGLLQVAQTYEAYFGLASADCCILVRISIFISNFLKKIDYFILSSKSFLGWKKTSSDGLTRFKLLFRRFQSHFSLFRSPFGLVRSICIIFRLKTAEKLVK